MKQKLVLLISVGVGLLAFWLTARYLAAERDKLYRGAEQVQILAANRDLPAGTVLTFADLARKRVYKTAVGENVFRPEDLERVLDKKLRFSLRREEPLWWSHVDVPEVGRGGLAPMVKSGLRALSIGVGGQQAVSGLVQPNDRVDVLGTFELPARDQAAELETVTLTMLQDVTVLATGQRLAQDELFDDDAWSRRAGGYNTVTLEVTPREAELLVFAQQLKGTLTLTLRNPADVGFERDLPTVNFDRVESSLPALNEYRQQQIRHKRD